MKTGLYGALAAWVGLFVAVCFIKWDATWLLRIDEWSNGDRFGFLVVVAGATASGAAFGWRDR